MGDFYSNDYSTTSYGATGGANGGGFMANGSQGNNAAQSDRSAKETLRPVTIKQILDAHTPNPDSDFTIDGSLCAQVTFVGQIRNISKQATNYTYKLDDGTGAIEVKRWIDPEEESAMQMDGSKNVELQDGMHVRVFGNLKSFSGKRHVGARPAGIRPVTDFNEVNYHLLEAAMVHLFYTRGPPPEGDGAAAPAAAHGGGGQDHQMNGGGSGGGAPMPAKLSARSKRLLTALRAPETPEEGLHLQEMGQKLNMQPPDVKAAVTELMDEGLIFTTTNDETFGPMER